MDRLHKKCLLGSTGLHLFLLVILFVGPAFLSARSKPDTTQIIDFVPFELVDAAVSGGGSPKAASPPPQPIPTPVPTPAPVPQQPTPQPPKPEVKPEPKEPVKETVKESPKNNKPDPDSLEAEKPKKPQISLRVIKRPNSTSTSEAKTAAAQAEERRLADARAKAAAQFRAAATSIKQNTASSTTIEPFGPGGGGPTYASYDSWVKTVYDRAWEAPENVTNTGAIAKATVVIANDGTVISARISTASGDSAVDASVRRTLERIKFIAPFPEGAKEKQRSYIINFNYKAKTSFG